MSIKALIGIIHCDNLGIREPPPVVGLVPFLQFNGHLVSASNNGKKLNEGRLICGGNGRPFMRV
jgi:hypothetical protein